MMFVGDCVAFLSIHINKGKGFAAVVFFEIIFLFINCFYS